MSTSYTYEALAAAAAVSTSISEVVRRLGGREAGGTVAHVGRRLRSLEIDISHFSTLQAPADLPHYERERLIEAVDGSASMAELLRRLGLDRPTARLRRHVESECARLDVDLSGLGHRRLNVDPAALAAAVAGATSIVETMAALGLSSRNDERKVARAIDRSGLDTSHFTRRAWRTPLPRPTPPPDLLVSDPRRTRRIDGQRLRKALIATGRDYRCDDCGTGPEWHGQAMTLEVDHISGDIADNRAENLRFLCPNCHAVTDSYCRKKQPVRDIANW